MTRLAHPWTHVRFGSIASIWSSPDYFRSSPENGHRRGRSPCLKGAKGGSRGSSSRQNSSATFCNKAIIRCARRRRSDEPGVSKSLSVCLCYGSLKALTNNHNVNSGRNCDAQRVRVVVFGCPAGYDRNGKRSRLDEIEMGTERPGRRSQLPNAGTRREGGRPGQNRQDLCARHCRR